MPQTRGTPNNHYTGESRSFHIFYEQLSQESSCWYYYPPGAADTVMIRTGGSAIAYSQWLQKEQANYYRQGGRITIRNHRQFDPDLAVWRLPTDPPALRSFLRSQDQADIALDYVAPSPRGLLVAMEGLPNGPSVEGVPPSRVADLRPAIRGQGVPNAEFRVGEPQDALAPRGQDARDTGRRRQATLSYDVSMEDYFRYDWSVDAGIVDERDEAHREGWTYFMVTGHLGAQPVRGQGRLPFVAAAVGEHGPSLRLAVGDDLTLLDSGRTAEVRNGSGAVLAHYRGGSLFRGLGRPWSGLHTIDTIRRDAALAGIAFTTRLLPDDRVEIVLHGRELRLTYRVDLYQDWIETLVFCRDDVTIGEWTFRYGGPDDADLRRLAASSPSGSRGASRMPDGLWLMRLADGSLTR